MKQALPAVIGVDKEKCLNCHACITACPVKFCNDGSGEVVFVNSDMCIGCGQCLEACTHDARYYIDDFDAFLQDTRKGLKMVAIVAPSVAANFPEAYLNLNGWLKDLGVSAVFDVSFGAELTVKSYLEHIAENDPKIVISQPCAALVSYIEIYQPELLPYLAPVDSPMLHTMKMIQRFYPQYQDHKIAIVSPCLAKKREFVETGYGDYNIAYKSIQNHLDQQGICLSRYPEIDFDNPLAERAVLFSTPGGLLRTIERWDSSIRNRARKIDGIDAIYEYLEKLPAVIEKDRAPLLIDCLSCRQGCNGGPLTLVRDQSEDEIEYWIEKRNNDLKALFLAKADGDERSSKQKIESLLASYWEKDLYQRSYDDLSENNVIQYPSRDELQDIFHRMHKYTSKDIYNCTSCGYWGCEKMAVAIFNGLNRPENCHFFLATEKKFSHQKIEENEKKLRSIMETTVAGYLQIDLKAIITETNPEIRKMLLCDDLEGRSIFDFLDAQNAAILKRELSIRDTNQKSTYDVAIQRTDGSTIFCLASASPIFNSDGTRSGSFAFLKDITQRKEYEKQLEEAKVAAESANREKSEILMNIGHEFKTPLSGIITASELALTQSLNSELEKIHTIIKNSGHTLLDLVARTMEFSKVKDDRICLDIHPFRLDELFSRLKTTFLFKGKMTAIHLNHQFPSSEIPNALVGDSVRLVEILNQLLENSAKFSTVEPTVVLGLNIDTISKEYVDFRFTVKDNGNGIDPAVAERIFQPFFQADMSTTRQQDGIGVGLSICKHLVDLMDGNIWVESELGIGSAFHFSVRLERQKLEIPFSLEGFKEQQSDKQGGDVRGNPVVSASLDKTAIGLHLSNLKLSLNAMDPEETINHMSALQQLLDPICLQSLIRNIDSYDYDEALSAIAKLAGELEIEISSQKY
ncbi:[Fe-Fe] hydrogenase large subunit C-terminal domain-containing protein [Desulfobacterales bacterium HSG17]|nr:[Fe-Fe] hydrogenase large subunit C-terminal domain-containing protein [Desulfobacterales bacterium HSG17]